MQRLGGRGRSNPRRGRKVRRSGDIVMAAKSWPGPSEGTMEERRVTKEHRGLRGEKKACLVVPLLPNIWTWRLHVCHGNVGGEEYDA